MNILLSSYSVNPYKGSEDAVGWSWTVMLSRRLPDSTIYLLTKKFNEEDTKKGIEQYALKNVRLIIVDVPDCLNWFREKHSAFHHMYYILWQKYAYKWAKNCGIKFDIVHHITMGNYRITGSMGKLDAYSIFGPVGGGQTTPAALRGYYKSQRLYEQYRDLVNKIFEKLPSYKKSINRFDKVYAVNEETKQAIEKASGRKCEKLAEISISEELKDIPARDRNNEATQIIYAGRFIELKGLMFLIDVIKEIKTDKPYHFTFYGSGELENEMKAKIKEYSLEDKVTLGGLVDHTEISKIYENADIFVHPTFRDSGGAVFVEAMAYRLPIIALNQSLSRELNDNKCGLFVNTKQSMNEIIKEFADKITLLIENRDLRQSLGENGFNYANSKFSLDYKFDTIYKNILQNL